MNESLTAVAEIAYRRIIADGALDVVTPHSPVVYTPTVCRRLHVI